MEKKIAIAYRIYPGISKKPAYFHNDKRKMSELCFASLMNSLGELDYHIWVILDKCPKDYESIFLKHCPKEKLTFIHDEGIGNALTFEHQIRILLEQDFSDSIMFAEDDYFYRFNAIHEGVEFLSEQPDAHFVTLFDHGNYYTLPLHAFKGESVAKGITTWRTVNSTCLTFLTTKEHVCDVKSVFLTYKKKNYDASIWLTITKLGLWSGALWKEVFRDSLHIRIVVKTFLFGVLHLILGKRKKLWCPYPSLSTHLEEKDLSPDVEWEILFRKTAKDIGLE